ncbi:hypothetical protein P0D69_45255 [Paraburkholderia sediminicola]|uniref:hypothetical protein n=1 Tax=Paraburkholderia sediminicola TaxID=458836 RepID=UPI0038BBC8A1
MALLRAQQYTWARLNEEIDFHGRMHSGWLCPNLVVAVTRGWARLQTAVCTTGMRRPLEGVVVSDTFALPPPGSARTSMPLSEREESPRITRGVRRDRLIGNEETAAKARRLTEVRSNADIYTAAI